MQPDVKREYTGWRDEGLSARHRTWGWDCPAIDIDFLMLEYDRGRAVALVEYKRETAPTQNSGHPSYRALRDLANKADLPLFACRYAKDYVWFKVVPLNDKARVVLCQSVVLSEREWVEFLYRLRGLEIPEDLFDEAVDI